MRPDNWYYDAAQHMIEELKQINPNGTGEVPKHVDQAVKAWVLNGHLEEVAFAVFRQDPSLLKHQIQTMIDIINAS